VLREKGLITTKLRRSKAQSSVYTVLYIADRSDSKRRVRDGQWQSTNGKDLSLTEPQPSTQADADLGVTDSPRVGVTDSPRVGVTDSPTPTPKITPKITPTKPPKPPFAKGGHSNRKEQKQQREGEKDTATAIVNSRSPAARDVGDDPVSITQPPDQTPPHTPHPDTTQPPLGDVFEDDPHYQRGKALHDSPKKSRRFGLPRRDPAT